MRINKSYYAGTSDEVSSHIIKGEIKVSYISPFLHELSFSLADLKGLHSVEPALIKIDFERWEKIIIKDKECSVALAGLKELANFAKDDVYFDENNTLHISFSKEEKGGKAKGLAVASMMPFGLIEAKEKADEEDLSVKVGGWAIENDALVARAFGMKLGFDGAMKAKIFTLISEYISQHIEKTEKAVVKRLNHYSPFLRIAHIHDNIETVKEILDEVYDQEPGKYYDGDKLGKLLMKILDIKNIKCI